MTLSWRTRASSIMASNRDSTSSHCTSWVGRNSNWHGTRTVSSRFSSCWIARSATIELQDNENQLEQLSRAEQELVEDTFRVLSISFLVYGWSGEHR